MFWLVEENEYLLVFYKLFFSAINTQNCTELNTTQTVHRGMSVTISCHYSTNSSLHSVVYFRRKHLLCYYRFIKQSWIKASCESHIKFIWFQEKEEIAFELLNLQISNSGIYTITVEEHAPPPSRCVEQKRIFIHVIGKSDYICLQKTTFVSLDLINE